MSYKKLHIIVITITLLSISAFSQEIGSAWIDVRGKNNMEVEKILIQEVSTLSSYSSTTIEETRNKLENENDNRSIEFNNRKVLLRTALNTAIDNKNDISIEVNDLKDQIALNQSEVSSLNQKIVDTDSSSTMSRILIDGEKSRIKDELTKIPFYEVMIARVKNFPENASNVSNYDNKMSHEISRKAIENQLGIDIITKTIVKDGTLTDNMVTTSLAGKANSNLTLALITVEDEVTKQLSFDRYRYGVVTVYPFQREDVSLTLTPTMAGIDVDVEIVLNTSIGITNDLPSDEKRRLNNLLNEKKLKNGDSESQINRLARNSKRLIALESSKIERNNKAVVDYKERIENIKPDIEDYQNQLNSSVNDLTTAVDNFAVTRTDYESHVFNESYVEVFPWEGYASADESITEKYGEFAVESFQEFLTSIKSEYLSEKEQVKQDAFSEIKETKKTDVVLNKIKLLGKFAESKGRRTQLSIYIAYNFGFEFEEAVESADLVDDVRPTFQSEPEPPKIDNPKKETTKNYNVNIVTTPAGATAMSGGKKIGKTPLQAYLEPGMNSLNIQKKGYKPKMDVLDIPNYGVLDLDYTLVPLLVDEQKNNKWLVWGVIGAAAIGGGVYYLTLPEEAETGSITLSIVIP